MKNLDQRPPVDGGQREPYIRQIWYEDCEPLSKFCTQEWLTLPEHSLLFGYFQLIYFTNRSVSDFQRSAAPDLICFDQRKCPALLDNLVTIEFITNLICTYTSNLLVDMEDFNWDFFLITLRDLGRECWGKGMEKSCPNVSYFHCSQSMKCIPLHYVRDGNSDCYYGEDEEFNACQMNDSSRLVCGSDSNICLASAAIGDGVAQCPSEEDELYIYTRDLVKIIPFSILCNREHSYFLFLMKSRGNDETDCNWWPCNNPNTRCDRIWDCPNGIDEINCSYSICSTNEHQCYSDSMAMMLCLPISHFFDRYIDDPMKPRPLRQLYFYDGTGNLPNDLFSWNGTKCDTYDQFNASRLNSHIDSREIEICPVSRLLSEWLWASDVYSTETNEVLCVVSTGAMLSTMHGDRFLRISHLGTFPPVPANYSGPTMSKEETFEGNMASSDDRLISFCHRGIAVSSDGDHQIKACLCPPNYFGDRCQWQNQRISLTLQFIWRSTTSTTVIFQAMIMLIDDEGYIAPYFEQILYVPARDCDTKFNIYLLYPDRPKNPTKNYSIRIDLFEKRRLLYWTSWLLPIPSSFLPVNRIATQLFIPETHQINSCSLSCGKHGQCTRYTNIDSAVFCRCQQGYSGKHCTIEYPCKCAIDSLCLAPSICVCSLHKFGPHCYLKHSICQSTRNPCEHNGLCVPNDDRMNMTGFTCFCTNNYSGDRCENLSTRIDIRLDDRIIKKTALVLLHLITAFDNAEHQRTTFLKKLPFNQPTLTLYISRVFHILFIQIPNEHYYLAVLREIHLPSEHIRTQIQFDQPCSSIDQLNRTLANETYFYRTKFYPLICRTHLDLRCFSDRDLMCICDLDRFSNCFQFNHSTNYDCQGYNQCENGGQCFQNNQTCPTKSTCICPDCYYGSQCQFSTKGFLFSLDPILAYHIKPHVSIPEQPIIIHISIAINTIMFVLGLVNSLLSILIFHSKKSRQLGSGNYLFASSLTSLLMIITLTLKFWDLILSQMSIITNRMWLMISCKSIDYLLKVFLASSEWLTACVAFERMISVNKGANFNKIKSQKSSKWVISIVFLLTTLTLIQDPISRRLIDDYDADERRIWCFVQYSHSIRHYNTFITLFHFLVPFSIHVITAVRIIKKLAHRRAIIQPEHPYQAHFQQELHRHQHILFAPCMLILLSLPRLAISFVKDCMRSAREPWFYLIGYFVSFVPSTLIFVVFVLSSKHYRRELNDLYARTLRRLRRI